MKLKNHYWIATASFSASFAVIVLALSAHFLEKHLDSDKISAITTAGQIQLFHALATILLAFYEDKIQMNLIWSKRFLLIGSLLFSISIYLLATIPLTGLINLKFLGPVTPIGGILIIAGWIINGIQFTKRKE
jgi:uncharacterized membrane protein YgdD (TMEM256/DUF423 family)